MANWQAIVATGRLVGPTFYTERFIEYAKEHCIECYVMNVNDESTYNCEAFDRFASQANTVFFTYNNIGILLKNDDGENFWKGNNIPVFDFVIDHPRAFPDMLAEPESDIYLLTLDRNHAKFCEKYYTKLKGVYFVPHAGAEWTNSIIPYEQRSIDVLYMGNCQLEIKDLPRISLFSDGGNDFYQKVSVKLYKNPLLSTEEAMIGYLANAGVILNDKCVEREFLRVVGRCIDANLRRISKLSGMQMLDKIGIHVDVYGDNWVDDEYPFSDNISIHQRVGREELLEKLGNAKISLCFIPWFRGGCSEKNFDSMLNGAVCVTDRSEYLLEHYKDIQDIVYFDISNPEQMAADVKWLLEHPKEAAAIAANGQKKARVYDCWEVRNRQICELISECLGL